MATFINLWKVAVVLHKPKGMTLNLKVPLRVMNVVLSKSRGSISAWWYSERKSKVENHGASAKASMHTSMRRRDMNLSG